MSVDKISIGFASSAHEELQAYAKRLSSIISQHRGYSLGHTNWFTHRGAGACWICDILNVAEFACSVLLDISIEDKKHVWRAAPGDTSSNTPGGDPLSFIFKPHRK